MHYKGSKIHKVIPNYLIQGGHLGTDPSGESIFGKVGTLPDEDLKSIRSWGPGTLAYTNIFGVPNSSSSQFFITTSRDPLPHLQGLYVAFGRVKSGLELLQQIARYGDPETGTPN